MEVEDMEITAKDRIWQCWFCSSYYPAQLTPVLALHLQWHIERCPNQEPGHHVCPGRTKEPKDGIRKACREKHDTPEELAHHILDTHTKKRWCSTENRKYRKAMNESLEEKDQLIKKLSADGTTPDRAFLPANQWRREVREGREAQEAPRDALPVANVI